LPGSGIRTKVSGVNRKWSRRFALRVWPSYAWILAMERTLRTENSFEHRPIIAQAVEELHPSGEGAVDVAGDNGRRRDDG